MSAQLWLSVGLGAGLGLMYGIAGHVAYRYAVRAGSRHFVRIVLGGMGIRLLTALVLFALLLALTPVHRPVFTGAFLFVFSAGLAREIRKAYRSKRT